MILSSLVKRYEDRSEVPLGWEKRSASYAIVLDESGRLISIDSQEYVSEKTKKMIKPTLILPTVGKGRSGKNAYETAFFLCDNADYMLGLDPRKFESSKKLHLSLLDNVDTPQSCALKAYFENGIPTVPEEYQENVDTAANYIFSVNNKVKGRVDYNDCDAEIREAWNITQVNEGGDTICLVTGKQDAIIKLHSKVSLPGLTMGGQPLIAMNDQTSFRSYGARTDAPPAFIGQYASTAYTSALNDLLKSDDNSVKIGNDRAVFWADSGGDAAEEVVACLFEAKISDEAGEGDLTEVMQRISRGDIASDINLPFYLLCLSPNAARISVRFFHVSTFGEIIGNIREHYERLVVVSDGRTKFEFMPIWLLLSETTIKKSASDAHPLLGGQLLRAVITNSRYPQTLYNSIIGRVRAGEEINRVKAAIIKAVLIKNYSESEVTTMALNEQTMDRAYVLGRLFSVLEQLQGRANGTATIRQRYFSSASANPKLTFPVLLNLSMHHAAKLDNATYFEKQKGELLEKLDVENTPFPAILSLEEQGKFILGYYHQTQAHFAGKNAKNQTNQEDEENLTDA